MSNVEIDDERCRFSLEDVSPVLKDFEIVLTADENLKNTIEADIFNTKKEVYVAHFKLNGALK